MSLDVYLKRPGQLHRTGERIFIREDGQVKQISRAEWDARFPEREPVTLKARETDIVYQGNITHNLLPMAEAAGICECLWYPERTGITHARQLIEPLRASLGQLRSQPEHFRQFNPANKWGDYEGFVAFVVDLLAACEANPDTEVSVWI